MLYAIRNPTGLCDIRNMESPRLVKQVVACFRYAQANELCVLSAYSEDTSTDP